MPSISRALARSSRRPRPDRGVAAGLAGREAEFDRATEDVRSANAERESLAVELEELRIAARETEATLVKEREAREALERSEVLAQDDARQAAERADRLAEGSRPRPGSTRR